MSIFLSKGTSQRANDLVVMPRPYLKDTMPCPDRECGRRASDNRPKAIRIQQ